MTPSITPPSTTIPVGSRSVLAQGGKRCSSGNSIALPIGEKLQKKRSDARDDDEARIGLASGDLRLADDAALAAPAAACPILEVLEVSRRLASPPALHLSAVELELRVCWR